MKWMKLEFDNTLFFLGEGGSHDVDLILGGVIT